MIKNTTKEAIVEAIKKLVVSKLGNVEIVEENCDESHNVYNVCSESFKKNVKALTLKGKKRDIHICYFLKSKWGSGITRNGTLCYSYDYKKKVVDNIENDLYLMSALYQDLGDYKRINEI